MSEDIEIRLLGAEDETIVAAGASLFDDPLIPQQVRAFLASDRDFLWFALREGEPVGFVSATIVLHPDKTPHLFINELATSEQHRRQKVATRLMRTVEEYCQIGGIWPVWVVAEGDDGPAKAFYRSLGDMPERGAIVFEWE